MALLSDSDIQFLADSIQQDGGELLNVDQDTRTFTFAFEDKDKMLALITAIKSCKPLARIARINSKFIDGKNVLTIDPS